MAYNMNPQANSMMLSTLRDMHGNWQDAEEVAKNMTDVQRQNFDSAYGGKSFGGDLGADDFSKGYRHGGAEGTLRDILDAGGGANNPIYSDDGIGGDGQGFDFSNKPISRGIQPSISQLDNTAQHWTNLNEVAASDNPWTTSPNENLSAENYGAGTSIPKLDAPPRVPPEIPQNDSSIIDKLISVIVGDENQSARPDGKPVVSLSLDNINKPQEVTPPEDFGEPPEIGSVAAAIQEIGDGFGEEETRYQDDIGPEVVAKPQIKLPEVTLPDALTAPIAQEEIIPVPLNSTAEDLYDKTGEIPENIHDFRTDLSDWNTAGVDKHGNEAQLLFITTEEEREARKAAGLKGTTSQQPFNTKREDFPDLSFEDSHYGIGTGIDEPTMLEVIRNYLREAGVPTDKEMIDKVVNWWKEGNSKTGSPPLWGAGQGRRSSKHDLTPVNRPTPTGNNRFEINKRI